MTKPQKKKKQKIDHYGNIQKKYFVTVFSMREQFSNFPISHFDKAMKNENEAM